MNCPALPVEPSEITTPVNTLMPLNAAESDPGM